MGAASESRQLAMYKFIAVDVETANGRRDSICQVGLAYVDANGNTHTESYLVDPQDRFSAYNIQLHGIAPHHVAGAPTFPDVLAVLRHKLEACALIQHSTFDKQAFDLACEKYALPSVQSEWINSVTIARKVWPEFKGNGGHGLANLKAELGLVFKHHDAEEDARAAAEVVLLAEERTGLDFLALGRSRSRARRT